MVLKALKTDDIDTILSCAGKMARMSIWEPKRCIKKKIKELDVIKIKHITGFNFIYENCPVFNSKLQHIEKVC